MLTVSLGMQIQGNADVPENDALQTRAISRVVYHKDFNEKTKVSTVLGICD